MPRFRKTDWDLLSAIAHNEPEKLRIALRCGADPNLELSGTTPLHLAAITCSLEIVRALIEKGADAHARNATGFTPLHDAVWSRENVPVIEALIAAGADVNATDHEGYTPLDVASGARREANAKALLEHGAVASKQENNTWVQKVKSGPASKRSRTDDRK